MPATNFDAVSLPGGALNPNSNQTFTAFIAGAQTTGTLKWQWVAPFAGTITDVRAVLGTAPTGATFIIDCNRNGTTVFTNQANRPTIAISGTASTTVLPDVTALAAGDVISFDVDQIGSGTAGSALTVAISYKQATVS